MTLHSARTRRILAALALVAAAGPIAALGIPRPATATSAFDAYAVKASGTALRVTVQTGYSFVVEPDAMLPRATASIEADQVSALASPLDPGDSVDALPGLGVPTAEQDIKQGAATPFPSSVPLPSPLDLPVPSPLAGATPPPQFSGAVSSGVDTVASVVNPTLTAPYEHAVATYPNPASPGPQRASFPPGSRDNVPPDFTDLLGLLSVQSSSGSATAGPGDGVADAGVGSAVSIPALGLSIGRTSSHVEVSGASGPAVSRVVTTLHDVDLRVPSLPGGVALPLPAGTELLHIGSLVLTVTTQRTPGAASATSQTNLDAADVTVMGHSARLDQNGLSLDGSPSPLNGPIAQLIGALSSSRCTPQPPVGVPNGPSLPVSQPVLTIGPPVLHDQTTHGGNERSVSMSGPTLCLATIAPVPNTSAQPLSPTPVIYTITLGDAQSSAYGISFPAESLPVLAPLLPAPPQTGVVPPGGMSTVTTTIPGSAGSNGSTHAHPRSTITGDAWLLTRGGLLSPRVVAAVASLAELALLATLWVAYRMAAASRRRERAEADPLDLV